MHTYDADYFLRGKETGKSLYSDYRWLPELTIPMAQAIVDYLDITDESILDFGCARGYLVKALRELGCDAEGVDVSQWAIENCDLDVKDFVHLVPWWKDVDWIIAKDVLEHVSDVRVTIKQMQSSARCGIFVVVPLSAREWEPYVVPEYEQDVTHIHRLPLATWASYFMTPGWEIVASYRVPGIKDNYAQWETGNGFIKAVRNA